MLHLLLETSNNRVISAHYCEDEEEQESLFVSIALDYGLTITDDILTNRWIELDDEIILQLVEIDDD